MDNKPLYIELTNNEVEKTTEIDRSDYEVNLDYDKQGFLCGIEVLDYNKLTIGLNALTLDQLILSILDKCATKIEEETYTENREEDNLVEHIVNEIRKFVVAPKE